MGEGAGGLTLPVMLSTPEGNPQTISMGPWYWGDLETKRHPTV